MRSLTTFLLVWVCLSLFAQVNYTANNQIKPYTGDFRAAMNLGYYPPFNEEQLAILSAGSKDLGVEGIGIKALRPLIPDNFTEVWGLNFRINTLKQYQTLGIADNTTIVGFPADWHRDATKYGCPNGGEVQSELFSNLYSDIWDGGANGTPYNDNNHFAAYLYKTVQMYKPYVKFWEIWNEPGFDFTGAKGWLPPGAQGNWWDNNPDPCDYKLRAPIFNFIRTLHIAYEIIKTVDPDAYVVLSGVGYASFLDAVCRNTENPNGGGVTPQYPLKGGAYFDVVGFHSYPHFDGSLRQWNNAAGAFDNFRHSDAAARGIEKVKKEFQDVLVKHGYNATTYPQKQWIITECNVPRKGFVADWGNPLIQRNFTMKAYYQSLKNNFIQNHFYKIADDIEESRATDDFDVMGFYLKPDYGRGFQQDVTEEGIALKTCTDMLFGRVYDAAKTTLMAMPNGVQGGAFRGKDGSYAYMLWAETTIDKSEEASATYSFPTSLGTSFSKKEWNAGYIHRANNITGQGIPLSATPIFITAPEANPVVNFADIALTQNISQPTASAGTMVTFTINAENKGNLNATSVTVRNVLPEGFDYVTPVTQNFKNGVWTIGNLSAGSRVSLAIQARVNSISQQLSNIAHVQSLDQKDDNISNNVAIVGISPATTPVATKVDIEMSMSVDRNNFVNGELITYTVTVVNQENVDATNIVADVPLKLTNFTVLNQFVTRGSYDFNTSLWKIPILKFREAVTLKLTMRITNATPIRHFLQIISVDQPDIDSTPNNGEQPEEDDQSIISMPNDGNPCYDDAYPPIFMTCPKDFTVSVTEGGGYVFWLAPTAKDRCGNPILTSNYRAGQYFPIGTYTVLYKATDNKGLVSNCSFTIKVQKDSIIVSTDKPDLEVKISASSPNYSIYTPFNVTISVSNLGTAKATNIKVDIPYPAGCVQGGQIKTSIGFYTGYWTNCTNCGLWYIPELAGGQTATFEMPVFPLDANGNKTVTAKVLSLDQTDGNLANNEASATVTPSTAAQTLSQVVKEYALSASPNPFTEILVLRVSAIQKKEADILIYNNLGRLVQSEKRLIEPGINKLKVDCVDLHEGFYFVVLKMPNVKDMYVKVLKMGG